MCLFGFWFLWNDCHDFSYFINMVVSGKQNRNRKEKQNAGTSTSTHTVCIKRPRPRWMSRGKRNQMVMTAHFQDRCFQKKKTENEFSRDRTEAVKHRVYWLLIRIWTTSKWNDKVRTSTTAKSLWHCNRIRVFRNYFCRINVLQNS